MRTKIISVLLIILTMIQLTGCKSQSARQLINGIDNGEELELRAHAPTAYTPTITGKIQAPEQFDVDTDKLTTHNSNGFRVEFNKTFEINKVSDKNYGNGLQGCLYTVKHEGEDITNGRACMADAFRNKSFIEDFWTGPNTNRVINRLNELAEKEYTDIKKIGGDALYAAISLYWNLFPDYKDDKGTYFCANAPLTREEFYALAYRAQTTRPIEEVEYDAATDPFTLAVCSEGHNPVYLEFAKNVDKYAWISTEDGSLNKSSIDKYITRAEAIYLLVMQNFPDIYNQVTDSSPAYSDTVSNGDMADKLGFKNSDGTGKKYWRAYTLKYMIDNMDKGMQSELYRAMATAKALDLINDTTARYNEALSRKEAIDLIIQCQIAKNKQYGYATLAKNGKILALVELPKQEIPEDILEKINNLTPGKIRVFELVGSMYEAELKINKYTQEEVDRLRMMEFDTAAIDGVLVGEIAELFPYWAYLNDYTDIYPTETLIGGKLAGENLGEDKSQGKGEESKLSNHDMIQDFISKCTIETDERDITYGSSLVLMKFTLQAPSNDAVGFDTSDGLKIYIKSEYTEEDIVAEIEAEQKQGDSETESSESSESQTENKVDSTKG